MEVTEHNITEWKLNKQDIEEILSLLKEQQRKFPDNKRHYGNIIAKLALMKIEMDN